MWMRTRTAPIIWRGLRPVRPNRCVFLRAWRQHRCAPRRIRTRFSARAAHGNWNGAWWQCCPGELPSPMLKNRDCRARPPVSRKPRRARLPPSARWWQPVSSPADASLLIRGSEPVGRCAAVRLRSRKGLRGSCAREARGAYCSTSSVLAPVRVRSDMNRSRDAPPSRIARAVLFLSRPSDTARGTERVARGGKRRGGERRG